MLNLRKIRRTIALTAASLALAGGTAIGAGGTASATTHPSPHLRTTEPVVTSASCGWIYIGQPGNVYGVNSEYAGQVEQMYNSCDGTVWAHYQWSGTYLGSHKYDNITLDVSSPYGPGYNTHVSAPLDESSKDWWYGGFDHGVPSPDAWRAGASFDQNGCVAWGTLHWYGGQDWSGPTAWCGSWVAPS
ncbi:hypothetical protein [Streptomyces sp. NPDC054783]